MALLSKLFSGANDREVKKMHPLLEEVNELEPEVQALDDEALQAKTGEFRERIEEGETLDDILPEAFAVAREAIRRKLGQRAFDTQVMGAMVLHQGKISELKTGEGKTLVAALALYLNALEGKGAHLITVNDYLSKRDAQWYGRVLIWMGVSVGVVQHDTSYLVQAEPVSDEHGMEYLLPCSRREAYAADVTYGTNHEFGFDYLRDNMSQDAARQVQRGRHFAIVDEVDNILIDEARTPLIISGQAAEDVSIYPRFAALVPRLNVEEDYTVDEKLKAVSLTEEGIEKIERALNIDNIYAPENFRLTRYMEAALKAQILYHLDRDYVVRDGEIVIVDDFTGRLMFGRRWSDGLHQAIEAKEGLKVQQESITYATITLQNYFRMYEKLAGMTGTAVTEAEEFSKIYKLEVVVMPTNRPMIREDDDDFVYRNLVAKFKAVADEVEYMHELGRPVLVGTVTIENSEYLSDILKRRGIQHQVLNAKFHEREAAIVADAGRKGAVTIATNMAGRGTDIILGGNPESRDPEDWQREHDEVVQLGGLHIIGTERHESRRIDNQLRGRSGRQGDPGSSRFYVSFEDDLMRRFAPDWLPNMLAKLGMEEDMPIESGWVSKALENAQTKVEGHNFDIRKHVVEYDDVMNVHRDVIYAERTKVLEGDDMRSNVFGMVEDELREIIATHLPSKHEEAWDRELLLEEAQAIFPISDTAKNDVLQSHSAEEVEAILLDDAEEAYDRREAEIGAENMRLLERLLLLQTIDRLWVEHLTAMDEMRQGIGLQAYGNQDPLVAYKHEAHDMWEQLLANIRNTIGRAIYHVALAQTPVQPQPAQVPVGAAAGGGPRNLRENRGEEAAVPAARQNGKKIGRNDPCYCGSGKKYKRCHGVAA
ncbi:MAG TPA: preprotein translocase subunit SecA [Dehalococcoidia bacterium]|jgi:preprotein translocase subunit SecA|nr:preprotein translocase subunit SecA [Dehalococcoidia bacterium]